MAHPRQYRIQGNCSPELSCDLSETFAPYQHGVPEPSFTEAMVHLQSHTPGFLGSQYAAETLDEARQLKVGRLKGDPLETEHVAVIREWTKERFPTSMYKEITRTTWQRGSQPMEPVVPLEFKLMTALKGAPSASGLNVTRVINADVGSKYKEGEEFCFWAPTSTTLATDKEILSKFGGDGSIAMFHLKLARSTAGRVISQYSYFPDEQEVLLLPGVKFKVSSVFTKDGLTTVTAEEIPPAACVRHLHAEQPMRVLVVGECGDGKSTLLNNLLGLDGEAAASAGLHEHGITKQISEYRSDRSIGGRQLVVFDSPGVGDKDVTPMELVSKIEEHLSSLDTEEVDSVIVTNPCLGGRFKLGGQVVKALVDKGFVGAEKWQNVILVGTKMDRASEEERAFFLDRIAATFFSACEGARGQAVLTSLDDVSQLLKALEVLPRSKVQYEKPDVEIMTKELARTLGIDEEVFQEKLIIERRLREAAALEAQQERQMRQAKELEAQRERQMRQAKELEAQRERKMRQAKELEAQRATEAARQADGRAKSAQSQVNALSQEARSVQASLATSQSQMQQLQQDNQEIKARFNEATQTVTKLQQQLDRPSPKPTPRKASPKPSPRKASPKPSPRKTSPKPAPCKTSPKPAPQKTSPKPAGPSGSTVSQIRVRGGDLLSCTEDGLVDLYSHDDATGRQRWTFVQNGGGWNIIVHGGTRKSKQYLSCTADGTVDLYSHDDGSGRQRWVLTKLQDGSYNIRPSSGTDSNRTFLSCRADGFVDLYSFDDDSGRQRWTISTV